METAWERTRACLQALADVARDLLLITDCDGRIEFLSRAPGWLIPGSDTASDISSRTGSVAGRRIYDLMPQAASEQLRACVGRVLARGEIECCRISWNNGEQTRDTVMRVGPVRCSDTVVALAISCSESSAAGSPDELPGAVSEASADQRREHLDAMAHAGRLSTTGQLVAAIAHEINQPLYAISNYAGACHNALELGSEDAGRQLSRWIKEIEIQSRRAASIISKLGDLVRSSPARRSAFDLNKLVITSLDLLRLEARDHQVRLSLELALPVPLVLGDPIHIEQVLVNLLRNAFEAMACVPSPGRRVIVRTELATSLVRVHVEDCGHGLSEADLQRLFEPFFTTKDHGMGMGMAICRSIVEAHGGRLWVTRNAVAGITAHFELPAAER